MRVSVRRSKVSNAREHSKSWGAPGWPVKLRLHDGAMGQWQSWYGE
jgi:hypothetical protein